MHACSGQISEVAVELSRTGYSRDHPPAVSRGSAADVDGLPFDRVEKRDSECPALDTQLGVFSGDPYALSEGLGRTDPDDA